MRVCPKCSRPMVPLSVVTVSEQANWKCVSGGCGFEFSDDVLDLFGDVMTACFANDESWQAVVNGVTYVVYRNGRHLQLQEVRPDAALQA